MTDLDQSQAKNSTNSLDKALPLVVDLDGTLIKNRYFARANSKICKNTAI